ncbi:carboxymuconolactone decarboxylase family protein [Marilutibacter spongiae]|uniref:Carboxymuconolactone decarboxylase family protein n=1 Tax=Marilutibacter spongiae TaxID=2025720 RepID=A0A7W3Y536_9GAMM|nr:carboxymuconolactone decarboxylase family protein [Lysobacter spongiae]MBB1059446.1 carboxymuconolactone decarboxylase family protein [Lysobacter spongiae]
MDTAPLDYAAHAPRAFQQLAQLSAQLHKGPLGPQLLELVSLRVSQLNACVFCLDMHAEALRRSGVAQRKLDTVAAWRESPLFDAREVSELSFAVAAIRAWNMLNVGLRRPLPETPYVAEAA